MKTFPKICTFIAASFVSGNAVAQSAVSQNMRLFDEKANTTISRLSEALDRAQTSGSKADVKSMCSINHSLYNLIKDNWKTIAMYDAQTAGSSKRMAELERKKVWGTSIDLRGGEKSEEYMGRLVEIINANKYCLSVKQSSGALPSGRMGYTLIPEIYIPDRKSPSLKQLLTSNCSAWGMKSKPGGFNTQTCYLSF